MISNHTRGHRSVAFQRRCGSIIVEFIVSFPILFIAFLAIFQFGFLSLVLENGTHAANEGAREASKVWGSTVPFDNNVVGNFDPTGSDDIADQVSLAMGDILNVLGLEIRQNGINDNPLKANALVVIERGTNTALRGNVALPYTRTGPAPSASEVVVTLCFPLVDSVAPSNSLGNPVPNWLAPLGFDLQGSRFELSARSELE